jgi:fused signal recognition particle receptor
LFESLKSKLSDTIGKISDKISAEEEEEKSSKTSEADLEDLKKLKESEKTSQKISKTKKVKQKPKVEKEEESPKKIDSEDLTSESTKKSEEKAEEKSKGKSEEKAEEKSKGKSEEEPQEEPEEEKSGILSFVRQKTISEKDVDDILFQLEMSLLEGDVALEVAEQIINSVKEDLVGRKIRRRSDVTEYTREALKKAISNILDVDSKDLKDLIAERRQKGEPLKIMFVGINGSGKTTTISKIADYFFNNGYKPVVAASDTFRAGAIEQLTHHADKIGIKIIKHRKGADPAAVAFDAVEHARAQGKDLVLVDTAGRMQTNVNLMDEMKKIK